MRRHQQNTLDRRDVLRRHFHAHQDRRRMTCGSLWAVLHALGVCPWTQTQYLKFSFSLTWDSWSHWGKSNGGYHGLKSKEGLPGIDPKNFAFKYIDGSTCPPSSIHRAEYLYRHISRTLCNAIWAHFRTGTILWNVSAAIMRGKLPLVSLLDCIQ